MRKELDRRLEATGECFEWAQIKHGLEALHMFIIEELVKTPLIDGFVTGPISRRTSAVARGLL
jgi:hypothetical protein